jgi:hypothetical protein
MSTASQFGPDPQYFALMRWTAFDAESFMWYLVWTTEQFIKGGKEQQFDKEGNVKPPKLHKWDSLFSDDSPNAKLAYLFAAKLSATEWHSYSKPVSRAMRDHFRLLIPQYEEDGVPTLHKPIYLPCYNGMIKVNMIYQDWFNPREDAKSKDAAAETLQQHSLVDSKLWSRLTRATWGIQLGQYVSRSSASPA